MNIQIEKILLHRRDGIESTEYAFGIGKINLISGRNGCGKTSFIKAVDYALCSDKCKIDLHICHAVDFIGVILKIGDDRHLFARHVPFGKDNGLLCYHQELNATENGFTVENFTKKTGISADKMLVVLNRLIGADVAEELSATGKTKHLSIRSLLDVVSQEYSVISDEENLFRNAKNTFSKMQLADWLPYVVGIRTTESMRTRIEQTDADARYRKLVGELTNARALSKRWVSELDFEMEQCRKFGLLGENDKFPEGIVGHLLAFEQVRKNANDFYAAKLSSSVQDTAAKELSDLEQKQQDLSIELQTVQERLDVLANCDREVDETVSATRRLEERLKLAEWLGEIWQEDESAPLFAAALGKTGDDLKSELGKMRNALATYEASLTNRQNLASYKLALKREQNALHVKRKDLEEKYRTVSEKIDARARTDAKTRELLDAQRAAYMQIGRIEKMVTLAQSLIGKGPDDNELEDLRVRAMEAAERVKAAEDAEKERTISFDGKIGELLTRRVRELDATRDMQQADASFDIKRLDIRLRYPDSEEWLSQRGSSSNHIAYHVALTSALQEYLIDRDTAPLPSFVFYDQPTQSKNRNLAVTRDLLFAELEASLAASKETNAHGWQPIVIDLIEEEKLRHLDTMKYHLVTDLDASGGFVPSDWWRDERG